MKDLIDGVRRWKAKHGSAIRARANKVFLMSSSRPGLKEQAEQGQNPQRIMPIRPLGPGQEVDPALVPTQSHFSTNTQGSRERAPKRTFKDWVKSTTKLGWPRLKRSVTGTRRLSSSSSSGFASQVSPHTRPSSGPQNVLQSRAASVLPSPSPSPSSSRSPFKSPVDPSTGALKLDPDSPADRELIEREGRPLQHHESIPRATCLCGSRIPIPPAHLGHSCSRNVSGTQAHRGHAPSDSVATTSTKVTDSTAALGSSQSNNMSYYNLSGSTFTNPDAIASAPPLPPKDGDPDDEQSTDQNDPAPTSGSTFYGQRNFDS